MHLPSPISYQLKMSQLLSHSVAVLLSLLVYSKPYLKLATLPCQLGIHAGLKWLFDIRKTDACSQNLVCQEKETWLTHMFSAMGVPVDAGECFALKFEIRNPKHETNLKSEFSNVQNVNIQRELSSVSVIWILVIRICFGFRYSDFGFTPTFLERGKTMVIVARSAKLLCSSFS